MDYNEWLLEDRLHVIDDIIIKPRHNFKINVCGDVYRDIVLLDLFTKIAKKYDKGTHALNTDEPEILISSIQAKESEEPVCAEYNEEHRLVKFNPMSVCTNEWVEWYINKYIDRG